MVSTFDYRGIGRSRPPSLQGFNASWFDWGQLDYEAIFRYADQSFPGPVDVVAHSIGGFIFGLATSSRNVRRAITVGAQYAFAPDYAPEARLGMIAKWHLLMPLLTLPFGFFPGKRLGWLEDTPKGVVYNWAFGRERNGPSGTIISDERRQEPPAPPLAPKRPGGRLAAPGRR